MTNGEYSVLGEYSSYHSNVKLIHNKSGCKHIYYVKPSNFYSGTRCPKCNESKGESEIGEVLTRKGVLFKRQYTFADCRNKYPLPFDFAIFDTHDELSFLIEYDGVQHFEPIEFFGSNKYFEETKVNDNIKNRYCQDKGIPLIRIPYWDLEKAESIVEKRVNMEENV